MSSQWESGWEGHDLAQRKRLAALSLIEKLAWLEEAQRVAARLLLRNTSGAKHVGLTPPRNPIRLP